MVSDRRKVCKGCEKDENSAGRIIKQAGQAGWPVDGSRTSAAEKVIDDSAE